MVKKIAVLTSGGDAPGMNAAIRAVVRTALFHGMEVYGVHQGYAGLIENNILQMESKSVSNIIQRGGTILKTARSEEFRTKEGRQIAYENLKALGIEALVIIGGDGSFKGAYLFGKEHDIPFVGIPGTIDGDIAGTEYTIGFDTAVNTAIEAIDKIKDTADAHDRLFVIEVMGRDAGYIALHSGVSVGAESILVPENPQGLENALRVLESNERKQKYVNMVVVAEGFIGGGANTVGEIVRKRLPHFDTRVCILGHIQRGGAPSARDRIIASRMGFQAIECLVAGHYNVMVGVKSDEIIYMPLNEITHAKTTISTEWFKLLKALS
ncbi:MAG: 6-phosphofructokinase [Chitinophagaceae bacterium]